MAVFVVLIGSDYVFAQTYSTSSSGMSSFSTSTATGTPISTTTGGTSSSNPPLILNNADLTIRYNIIASVISQLMSIIAGMLAI